MIVLAQASGSGALGPSALEGLLQFAYYAGLVGLLGGAAVAAWVFAEVSRALVRLLFVAWTVAAIGAGGIAISRWSTVGDFGVFIGTPLGTAAVVRAGVLVIAHEGLIVARYALRHSTIRRALIVVILAAAASAYGHVLSSHAAIGSWAWGHVLVQWVHIVAVGIWIGGLAMLLAGVRGAPDVDTTHAVRRFSALAGIALGVVAVTGFARALDEVGGFTPLLSTTYGRLAIVKVVFLLVLAALGALNRYRHVPAATGDLRGLRRIGSLEIAIAIAAFAVTSMLSQVVPAREAWAETQRIPEYPARTTDIPGGPTLYDVSLPDGSSVQVFLEPDRPGENELHATFFGADGAERQIDSFELRVPQAPSAIKATPERFSGGHFLVDVELAAGEWFLELIASAPAGEVRAGIVITLA